MSDLRPDMTPGGIVYVDPSRILQERPTLSLRWYWGKLQQQWMVQRVNATTFEWREVPEAAGDEGGKPPSPYSPRPA